MESGGLACGTSQVISDAYLDFETSAKNTGGLKENKIEYGVLSGQTLLTHFRVLD